MYSDQNSSGQGQTGQGSTSGPPVSFLHPLEAVSKPSDEPHWSFICKVKNNHNRVLKWALPNSIFLQASKIWQIDTGRSAAKVAGRNSRCLQSIWGVLRAVPDQNAANQSP